MSFSLGGPIPRILIGPESDPKTCVFMMDVPAAPSYLTGLLNRMVIKAIAVSPFIRYVNQNHEAWERRMPPLCN